MTGEEAAAWSHDAFCGAIEAGEPFYLACPEGHGSVPPRRVCPDCGAQSLTDRPLPETGRVQASTVVHVATAAFAESAPYVTAIADFGPVSLTGVVTETPPEEVEYGTEVTVGIERTDERARPTLVFEPK
ncbi:Zn-ribbon domain-containing OB-fold protein [Haloarcula onubensis]|uniref:OB-fold domain-containing protein n=1 Tax=Haloarcula onubensis TaxID=2950539 RepID=A0ABU2FMD3_9EURY|nr:OB-fold domain-containing protein [Halomicroarcula sp. S3CR25-11]MDS0281913.1 OB-fold domain-containing protein [Halomicroarcula sp. S3CR25-11]